MHPRRHEEEPRARTNHRRGDMLHQPVNVIRRVRWIGNKDIILGIFGRGTPNLVAVFLLVVDILEPQRFKVCNDASATKVRVVDGKIGCHFLLRSIRFFADSLKERRYVRCHFNVRREKELARRRVIEMSINEAYIHESLGGEGWDKHHGRVQKRKRYIKSHFGIALPQNIKQRGQHTYNMLVVEFRSDHQVLPDKENMAAGVVLLLQK